MPTIWCRCRANARQTRRRANPNEVVVWAEHHR
jgi:hypothetical protein